MVLPEVLVGWIVSAPLAGQGSLIAPQDAWLLWTVITASVALSIYLEQTYRWAAKLSGPVIALVLAMALSNIGVMPSESATYDIVQNYLTPVAVTLLLFRANLRRMMTASRSMFLAFQLAMLGTLMGTVLAAAVYRLRLAHLAEISGLMAASYIGGGVNFVAVKQTFSTPSSVSNPLLVADNFVMAAIFLVLVAIADSRLFRRWFSHPHIQEAEAAPSGSKSLAAEHWKPKTISLLNIAVALGIGVAIAGLSAKVASHFSLPETAAGGVTPSGRLILLEVAGSLAGSMYVWITLITLAAVSLMPAFFERTAGAEEIGGYLLYVFLFVIGLPADLVQVLSEVPAMFGFCLIIAAMNLGFTLLAGKWLGLNLEELLLASNATLGGPPTAAAMAVSKGWSKLVVPGLLIGIWGYVIGTAIGIAVVESFRRIF